MTESASESPGIRDREESSETRETEPAAERAREIGGRDGPDPTRYGDWEKNGRCIDF